LLLVVIVGAVDVLLEEKCFFRMVLKLLLRWDMIETGLRRPVAGVFAVEIDQN
jgi:hypothetical protein